MRALFSFDLHFHASLKYVLNLDMLLQQNQAVAQHMQLEVQLRQSFRELSQNLSQKMQQLQQHQNSNTCISDIFVSFDFEKAFWL